MAFGIKKEEVKQWKRAINNGEIAFLTHYWLDDRFKACNTVTKVGAQPEQINPNTQPEQTKANKPEQSEQPANFGQPDCDCKHCQQHRDTKGSKLTLNHGAQKTANGLGEHEINRVSLPGDVDYIGAGSAIAIAGGTA